MKRVFLSLVFFIIVLSACSNNTNSDKLEIITTVYPLEYLADSIVDDNMEVKSIYPKGGDIHSYELTARDIQSILDADLFIGVSEELEPFISTIKESVDKGESDVKIVEVAKEDKFLKEIEDEDFSNKEDSILKDYHIWTSPKKDIIINEIIYDAILSLDIYNNDVYEQNFNDNKLALENLDNLYNNYSNKKTIYISHDAYYWLRRDYNMNIVGVNGVDEHDEASAKDLENIIEDINSKGISYVYSNLDDKNNKTIKLISNETGVDIEYLSDLEVELDDVDFFKALENNLTSIKKIDM